MIKLNSDVRKILQKSWLWLIIIVASVGIWLLAFYWASQPSSKVSFEVWVGAEDKLVDDSLSAQLETICTDYGMKRFSVNNYNPDDYFYPQAFALQSRSVEIFILHKDEALTIAEVGIFRVLGERYNGDNTLEYNGEVIGVQFVGDYYVLINDTIKKDSELLLAVLDKIVNYEVNNG